MITVQTFYVSHCSSSISLLNNHILNRNQLLKSSEINQMSRLAVYFRSKGPTLGQRYSSIMMKRTWNLQKTRRRGEFSQEISDVNGRTGSKERMGSGSHVGGVRQ